MVQPRHRTECVAVETAPHFGAAYLTAQCQPGQSVVGVGQTADALNGQTACGTNT
jgi:hypothetical protein